jgi:hypothetical protein
VPSRAKVPRAPSAKPAGLSKNEIRRREALIAEAEREIETLEAEKAELLGMLSDPALAPDDRLATSRRYTEVEAALEARLAQWEAWQDEISG